MIFLRAFVVGSSLLAFLITIAYTGNAFKKSGRLEDVPFEMFPIFIPLTFGVANMLNVWLGKRYGKYKQDRYLIAAGVGALVGLLFSSVGRFSLGLPQKIFGFSPKNEWQVHLIAIVMYAVIFSGIVQTLNEMM